MSFAKAEGLQTGVSPSNIIFHGERAACWQNGSSRREK
jgi:hypothetical protein